MKWPGRVYEVEAINSCALAIITSWGFLSAQVDVRSTIISY